MQSRGFPVEWMSELKRKNDLVTVASNYLKLEQKGSRFWACCPFHNEKTPSFSISDEGFYHCFGCKESGDVIKFVQKMENVDFLDAVRILAEKVGMQVPEFQSSDKRQESQKQKERLLSALDYAYKHYIENLYNKDAKVAQDYIKQRRFTRRELEDFKIGYSKNWTDIVQYLKSKGFTEKEMLDAGICQKKNGGDSIIDAYGGRLIFPIFNSFNECVGFSGRTLEKNPEFAKYKNTAETPVFQKRRIVFGINILKSQKQQQLVDKVILVEGQMDVIAMHKAGFKSTVACMGTALTNEHVRELKRYSNNIYLCFDGDGAGTKATIHGIEMFRNEDVNLKIIRLTGGKDPDEILNNYGREKLQECIDNAMPYMEFLIEYHKSRHNLDDPEDKGRFVKDILAEIKKLGSETLFEPYLEKIRDLTKIPIDVLRRDINIQSENPKTVQQEIPVKKVEKSDDVAVKFILASILGKKDVVDERIDYRKLLEGYEYYLDIIEQSGFKMAIYDIEGADEDEFLNDIVNFNFHPYENDMERYFKECLWKIAEKVLKKMQAKLNEEYKNCEDLVKRSEIARKMGKIVMQLKSKSLEEFNVRRKN